MKSGRRLLHYVLKIGDRPASIDFFRRVLGMHVLRHEEFDEGCKATCNGPYDGRWSKTMVGYGAESSHFVLELTYNYGVGEYKRGNDLYAITVHSRLAADNVRRLYAATQQQEDGALLVEAPGGYKLRVYDRDVAAGQDPLRCYALSCTNLARSLEFWRDLLGLKLVVDADRKEDGTEAQLMFCDDGDTQRQSDMCTSLRLVELAAGVQLQRAGSFGRTAISCPGHQLADSQQAAQLAGFTVLTSLVQLDTPGKASVHVVILADRDGHEVCLVDEEGFSQLSLVDPAADQLLDEAMLNDKSSHWFSSKRGGKSTQ